jgi:hypothetical protein
MDTNNHESGQSEEPLMGADGRFGQAISDDERGLEHFHKCCSAADSGVREAVFLTFDFVSAQSQGLQTCSFAKASSKVKNPRSAPLHHFCQCSSVF